MYVSVGICTWEDRHQGTQKLKMDLLELKLQVVVGHLIWMLGTERESSTTAKPSLQPHLVMTLKAVFGHPLHLDMGTSFTRILYVQAA